MERKDDDDAIAAVVHRLKHDIVFDSVQRGWIGNLYHVTDVRNAASILATGRLLCHDEAVQAGVLQTAASAAEIMDGTQGWVHRYVRLYFRPRTPTFYRNEGLRPAGELWKGAHCPVPVAFVFDAPSILGMRGVRWSRGNLASHGDPVMGDDARSLDALPFDLIYHHRKPGAGEDQQAITFHRQAEVVVPEALDLSALRAVLVRSQADRQSLRTLLDDEGVGLAPLDGLLQLDHRAFYGKWTAIDEVAMVDGGRQVRFACTPPMEGRPTFAVRLRWEDHGGVCIEDRPEARLDPYQPWRAVVPESLRGAPVRVRLWLDDALAFTGWFDPAGNDVLIPPARP